MSIWLALPALAVLMFSAWLLSRFFGAPAASGRFSSIDGLRGYLAFGVYIHHGAVWHDFLRTGEWRHPDSFFYTNMGHVSVILFFMITGFLFWSKLLRGRSEPIDWFKLFLSRFLRLQPLYFFALALLVVTVAILSEFHLQAPVLSTCKELLRWSALSALPDLNGFENTYIIIAGVTWSLRFEWWFYLALPLMALLVSAAVPRRYIFGSLLIAGLLTYRMQPNPIYLSAFGGGIIAAYLVQYNLIPSLARGTPGSAVVVVILAVSVTCFPTAYQILPIALLTVAFSMIVAGNTLFGILEWAPSRYIGQLTYSIYLLHGILLFWIFRFVIGFSKAASYSLFEHWFLMWSCIPMVLLVCAATFKWIEMPGMQSGPHLSRWWQNRPKLSAMFCRASSE